MTSVFALVDGWICENDGLSEGTRRVDSTHCMGPWRAGSKVCKVSIGERGRRIRGRAIRMRRRASGLQRSQMRRTASDVAEATGVRLGGKDRVRWNTRGRPRPPRRSYRVRVNIREKGRRNSGSIPISVEPKVCDVVSDVSSRRDVNRSRGSGVHTKRAERSIQESSLVRVDGARRRDCGRCGGWCGEHG